MDNVKAANLFEVDSASCRRLTMPSEMKFTRRPDTVKLAIIAIVLIDITIAAIWFYRPTYPTAQMEVIPMMVPSQHVPARVHREH